MNYAIARIAALGLALVTWSPIGAAAETGAAVAPAVPAPPFSTAPTPPESARSMVPLYRAGLAALGAKRYARAIVAFTAVGSTPGINKDDAYRVFLMLGRAYVLAKSYPSARQSFAVALRMHPDSSRAWQMLAYVDYQVGDKSASASDLLQAGKVDPNLSQEWSNDALTDRKKNKLSVSFTEAKMALAIDPQNALAKTLVCDDLTAAARFADAVTACSTALAAQNLTMEYQYDAYSDRSYARARTKDFRRGLDDANAALRLAAKPEALDYFHRGYIESCEFKSNDAVADLSKAIALDPKLADAYAALGGTYQDLGQNADAKAQYAIAARLDPAWKTWTGERVAEIDHPPVYISRTFGTDSTSYDYAAERQRSVDGEMASERYMEELNAQALETMNEMNEAPEPVYEPPSE